MILGSNWKLTHVKASNAGEQAGANFLVHQSGVEVFNLCLPPYRMEPAMAVDYPKDFEPIKRGSTAPAFIDYAGSGRKLDAPIARLTFEPLTASEVVEMKAVWKQQKEQARRRGHWPLWARAARKIITKLDPRFQVAWAERGLS